jgi:hypothetical protein
VNDAEAEMEENSMDRKHVIRAGLTVLILAAVMAFGCATPDTPGSDNTPATGVILRVMSLSAADGATGNNTVDVVFEFCQNSTTTFEKNFDVSMSVDLLNDSPGGDLQSTKVTILSYTVDYISDDPGSVHLPSEKYVTQSLVIDAGGSQTISLLLMSVRTKIEFISRGGDPALVPTYQARVTFYGVNDFGYEVKAVGSTYLEIGDWQTC